MATKTIPYKEVRAESLKPLSERKAMVRGRDGELRVPRRYAMRATEIVGLRKEAGKSFPNPFRSGGVYHGVVQSLINLGVDKAHTFADFKGEMKSIMSKIERGESNAWDIFSKREPRKDAKNPKDLNGRIMQTVTVLQRLTGNHRYGLKLAQLKSCIDILADKDRSPMYMLNTGFKRPEQVRPTNDLKRRKTVKAKDKAPKAKKTAKK